jgi:hypothetical protein
MLQLQSLIFVLASAQPTEENDEVSDDNTSKKKVKESKPTRESSWFNFGGWWKRIKPNSNQMNLPDDKKKSVIPFCFFSC